MIKKQCTYFAFLIVFFTSSCKSNDESEIQKSKDLINGGAYNEGIVMLSKIISQGLEKNDEIYYYRGCLLYTSDAADE